MILRIKNKTHKSRVKLRSKVKRGNRSKTNKRRRINLVQWSILKALILKRLKVLTLAKRKMLMQRMSQLPKIRYLEIRRAGASRSLR